MSTYLNQVTLIGRIGRSPEISKTNDDKKIAKFSIATSEFWRDKETMERKEKTEWHRIVVFSPKLAEIVEQYAAEGSLIFIEGKLRTEKWTNSQGQEQKSTTIVIDLNGKLILLDRNNKKPAPAPETHENPISHESHSDDDIPF